MIVLPSSDPSMLRNSKLEDRPFGVGTASVGVEMPRDPETGAMREKLNVFYDLVPFEEFAEAYQAVAEYGATKYEPWNWTKGLSRVQLASSAARHLFAILRGERFDDGSKGSGLPHSYHLLWNAVALVHNEKWGLKDGGRPEPKREYYKR